MIWGFGEGAASEGLVARGGEGWWKGACRGAVEGAVGDRGRSQARGGGVGAAVCGPLPSCIQKGLIALLLA
jgi:hypothetical protein